MMGPEASLVTDRLTEMRRFGGYPMGLPSSAVPMYAEAAARARLEPPSLRPSLWARLRASLRGRSVPGRDSGAAWSVAAAPIVAKADPVREAELGSGRVLLAALPVRRSRDD